MRGVEADHDRNTGASGAYNRNVAAVLYGIKDLRVQDWPLPPCPPPGHARVAVKAVGICGSDVHFLKHGRIGEYVVKSPMVIGHESAGVVVQLGPAPDQGSSSSSSGSINRHLLVGDAVALEPGVPCWHCQAAREGRYNLDPNIQFFATPPVHGSLATFVDHPVELCYKLPPGLSLEQGAMCEPLSVGVHACRRGQVQPGKSVAVLGAGPIGLVVLMTAAAFGADQVVITDVCQEKLQFAERHYKASTLLINAKSSPSEVAKQLQKAFATHKIGSGAGLCQAVHESATAGSRPDGDEAADAVARCADENELTSMEYAAPDIVIDCVGVQQTLDTAVRAVAAGGKVVLVGMGAEDITLPAQVMTCKEIDLLGSFRYANTYPLSLSLLSSRRVDVMPLITHRFSFTPEDVAEGFSTAAHANSTGAIKVMFNMEQQPAS